MTLVMGNKGMLDKIGALWNIAIAYGTSCWAYFQPVHHLLEVLLVVLLANFIARLIQSVAVNAGSPYTGGSGRSGW